MAGEGRASVGERLPELFTDEQRQKLTHCLTLPPRQQQIARLLCRARTNRQMAAELGIAPDTVRMHMRMLFEKLEVHDRIALVVRLVRADQELPASLPLSDQKAADEHEWRSRG